MAYSTVTSIVAGIFGFIDSVIYSLVSIFLTGLYNISETKIFSESSLTDFTNNIYVILGIFMLFKLAFSLLSSIIDPDKANDKQAGMQKIITRVVITLSLLLMVPTIFQVAYSVQGNILRALPQVILGPSGEIQDGSVGENIALTVMTAFVNENDDCEDEEFAYKKFDNIWEFSSVVSEQCQNPSGGEKVFKYRYTFLVSSVVGIIMIIFVVLCSIDVAIRMIKLAILQIIAPIPIMTYIDPKSEKDGAFGNWTKECLQTYISLFLQLGVIYIVIYLVSGIANDLYSSLTSGDFSAFIEFPEGIGFYGGLWVFIFIVIGCFFFMRQAPKFLLKVLGIKDGIGLGIGLNAGLAGVGALTGGAGLLGTAKAIMTGLDEGATANAEGKSAFTTGGLRKGRDIAAQFKTGDPKEKAKTASEKINDAIMSSRASKLGLTNTTVANAKKAKFNAADALSDAQSLRTRFQNANGDLSKMSQNDIDKLMQFGASDIDKYGNMSNEELVDAYVNAMNTQANKASTYYDKATKLANIYGVKTDDDLYDEFNPKYQAKNHKLADRRAEEAIGHNRDIRKKTGDVNYDFNRGFNPDRYNPKASDDDRK